MRGRLGMSGILNGNGVRFFGCKYNMIMVVKKIMIKNVVRVIVYVLFWYIGMSLLIRNVLR